MSFLRRLALIATAGAVALGLAAPALAANTTDPVVAIVAANGSTIASFGGGAFAYPADGSVLSIAGGDSSTLQDVRVLGGQVTAQAIHVGEPTTVDGLTIGGAVVTPSDNLIVPLSAGWAMAQQHAVVPGADGGAGRETAVGLRIHLAQPVGGLAAGTEILIGNHVYATTPDPASGSSGAPLAAATAEIPADLIPIYKAAGQQWGIAWSILAAVNKIETNFGRNLSVSTAGAIGWMQFMPGTWKGYGYDADGNGKVDPYNATDAIFSAARLLAANDGGTNPAQALYAYNHADWYVQEVLAQAKAYATGNQADARVPATSDDQSFSPVHLW